MKKSSQNERGNALFFILIAVALFAALSYAISDGGSGTTEIEKTRSRVVANDIISYGASIGSAVEQIKQEGFSENDISFAHGQLASGYGTYDSNAPAEVFNPRGGGVTFQIPGGVSAAGDPIFTARNDVRNVGSRCADVACSNCSVANDPACVDLVMFQPLNNIEVCKSINKILEIGDDVDNIADLDGSFVETIFNGDFAYQSSVESTGAENIFNGESTGCFVGSTGAQEDVYYFYHVLMAR